MQGVALVSRPAKYAIPIANIGELSKAVLRLMLNIKVELLLER